MIAQVPLDRAGELWNRAYESNQPHVPFLSYDWHALWYRVFGKASKSSILSFNDEVIAPFVRTGSEIRFSGGEEIADYLDLVGPDDKKSGAWTEIISHLKLQGITKLHLRNVPESSATLSVFPHVKEDTTPKIALPATWDAYLATLTRKYRHELERKIRKVEREHLDASFRQSDNPGRDISILLELMEKDRKKQKFLTPEMKMFFTEMAKTFSNQISLFILSMGDKHVAATFSFVVSGKQYLYNSGFDKTCCQNGGFYLKAQTIKRAIEQGLREYNFLQGSERYKYELGGKDFGVYSINWHLTA